MESLLPINIDSHSSPPPPYLFQSSSSGRHWAPPFWPVLALLLALCFVPQLASAQRINYRVQSLFIYKFTRYISWPPGHVHKELVIGVYGNSPILEELTYMANLKKTHEGLPIVVKRLETLDHIDPEVHILYLAASKSRDLRSVLDRLKSNSTLVVAERGGLAKKGACINFMILEDNTVRLELNRRELKARRLDIEKELLNFAFIVSS